MDKYYLIEHDRHGKIPTRITEYAAFDDAEGRLSSLDVDQLDELNACLKAGRPVRMEYVVICSESVDSIKRTHARYFRGDYEVLIPTEIRHIDGGRQNRSVAEVASSAASIPAAV